MCPAWQPKKAPPTYHSTTGYVSVLDRTWEELVAELGVHTKDPAGKKSEGNSRPLPVVRPRPNINKPSTYSETVFQLRGDFSKHKTNHTSSKKQWSAKNQGFTSDFREYNPVQPEDRLTTLNHSVGVCSGMDIAFHASHIKREPPWQSQLARSYSEGSRAESSICHHTTTLNVPTTSPAVPKCCASFDTLKNQSPTWRMNTSHTEFPSSMGVSRAAPCMIDDRLELLNELKYRQDPALQGQTELNTESGKRKKGKCESNERETKKKTVSRKIDDMFPKESDEANSTGEKLFSILKNVADLSVEETTHLLNHAKGATEVAITIIYQNGTTLLSESAYKLHGGSYDVKGCVVAIPISDSCPICNGGKEINTSRGTDELSYVLLSLNRNEESFVRTKSFLESLMKSNVRKLCFNAQQLIEEVVTALGTSQKIVCKGWRLLDMKIASWLLDPDQPAASFSLLKRQNTSDNLMTSEHMDLEEMVCRDLSLFGAIMKKLYHQLVEKNLWNLFYNLETVLCTTLALLELRGLTVNTDIMKNSSDTLKRKLDQLERSAHQAAGEAFLINSHPQLRHIIFDKLRLDTLLTTNTKIARTSSGNQKSTSEAVLNQLQHVHPLPKIVLEYRQIQKMKSTYVDGMFTHVVEGKLHTHWDQTSAATGRLASTHPNIQSIPKQSLSVTDVGDSIYIVGKESTPVEVNARDPFISSEGWCLLTADFQQMEFRVLAHLSGDGKLIGLFNETSCQDIFKRLTAEWFGKEIAEVTELERDQTKRVVYSVMYGVGKEKLADILNTSSAYAKGIMDSFLVTFPGINHFSQSCKEEARRTGFLRTILHRRRWFPNINHPNFHTRAQSERQAFNFCVQGSAADICKAAMIQVEHRLADRPHMQARLLVQIHDELLFEVPDSEVQETKDLVKNIMEDIHALTGGQVKLKVPLKISLKVGKSWGRMESAD